ncbi:MULTISPECIES: VOC family protein [Flavobacterium]|uniref:VOC family protein n=1 Tax=Flavobacterium TaxID=237 RepID=UPI000B040B81|nr:MULTISPECIES: VOC family protein [Flavobacterium]
MDKLIRKITPFLWFDNQAEEAMNFYISIFNNAKILKTSYYSEGGPAPAGTLMTASFQLEGQEFIALNGGPQFAFTPAVSFVVNCHSQQEIDELWDKLSEGGQKQKCGWLLDQFGLSWQIVPTVLETLMSSGDAEKSHRVMMALLQMDKLDIKTLQDAYDA